MNAKSLKITKNITLDIDSELHVVGCVCTISNCRCKTHTTSIRCTINSEGHVTVNKMSNIKQRKGEAELAQIDWLIEYQSTLQEGEAAVSIVTSGDIDSVILHLFAMSY